jgi:pimeloyl-ACP methyl ester carboxylesterase
MISNDYTKWMTDLSDYALDAGQRSVLYMDILRKRGNVYLEHLHQDQPPVLVFDYETIMDGRSLGRPVNYALVRIIDRRREGSPDRRTLADTSVDQKENRRVISSDRRYQTSIAEEAPTAVLRPIVIFDPRAGHGPGIGGSKKDSQIGMALDAGHPVYFLIFSTRPEPGQTLADVRNAQIQFLEKVRERHPDAPRPAVIGNCQGGWAAALVGAERPDLVGPMVFNGSPLSYWGGVEGVNPMRYLGGLIGGVWLTSLLSDLGNGIFDGANLVSNFENLNPANTLWSKQYNVYANVDTEEKRYLGFEKWWGGFFLLTDKEIHKIVEGLFIGNKLERGEFELDEGRRVDLKRNSNPVIVFASFGDNITPPQQAYNWIIKTYGTVEEIKRRGQVILFVGHSKIGHLGIFVSAKIARKEHKEIIASFDMLNYLPPGLYAMEIEDDPDQAGEYAVRYVEKTMDDIMAMDDGLEDEKAFFAVKKVSEAIDSYYRNFISPWVRLVNNDVMAEGLRQLHPLRVQRYLFSDLNPWMMPYAITAARLQNGNGRQSVGEDNIFRSWEKAGSDFIVAGLNTLRDTRDAASEWIFQAIYENPWMAMLADASGAKAPSKAGPLEQLRRRDADRWRKYMTEGEFPDAMIRILLAVGFADQVVRRKGYDVVARILAESDRMKGLESGDMRQMIREQARIVQTDADQAIKTLPYLLKGGKDRQDALSMIDNVVSHLGRELEVQESAVLERIKGVLLSGN